MPGGKNLNLTWCSSTDFKEWLVPGRTDFSTKCKVCVKEFSVEGGGIAQVRSTQNVKVI